jgi:hypothetical protein
MLLARLESDEEQQMGRAETLYSELRDLSAIEGLILLSSMFRNQKVRRDGPARIESFI